MKEFIDDAPAVIPAVADSSKLKFPVESIFRSVLKLLVDTATSEYLFSWEFFGESGTIFHSFYSTPPSLLLSPRKVLNKY